MIDLVQEQIDALMARLSTGKARDREMAARSLSRVGARAIPKLLAALRDEDWTVRRYAAFVFVLAPHPRAVPLLCELARENYWELRWTAVSALKAAGDPRSIETLAHRLSDIHPKLRALAAEALLTMGETGFLTRESLGEGRHLTTATNRLEDTDPRVRSAAALVLGYLGDVRAIKPLGRHVAEDQPTVAAEAATALGRLGTADAIGPLLVAIRGRREERVQVAACRSLGLIGGEEAIGCLILALRSRSTQPRREAALQLSRLAKDAPCVALLSALHNLRWCLAQGWWLGDDDSAIYSEAIRSIEVATLSLRDLPIPAVTEHAARPLPIPAQRANSASQTTPVASQSTVKLHVLSRESALAQWLRERLRNYNGPSRLD